MHTNMQSPVFNGSDGCTLDADDDFCIRSRDANNRLNLGFHIKTKEDFKKTQYSLGRNSDALRVQKYDLRM